jgi:hypothetical protein
VQGCHATGDLPLPRLEGCVKGCDNCSKTGGKNFDVFQPKDKLLMPQAAVADVIINTY